MEIGKLGNITGFTFVIRLKLVGRKNQDKEQR